MFHQASLEPPDAGVFSQPAMILLGCQQSAFALAWARIDLTCVRRQRTPCKQLTKPRSLGVRVMRLLPGHRVGGL